MIALTSTPDGRRLAEEAFGDEVVWLDYQRPGFDMSRRIARAARGRTRRRAPSCSRSTGSSPGARRARRATARRSSSSSRAAAAIERRGRGRFGLGGPNVAALGGRSATDRCSRTPPALRGALLADATASILEVDRSPEAVAFASAAARARGQPDRRAVPRPPDQHEAQAARRRVRPASATTPTSSRDAFRGRRRRVRRRGTATTTSGTSTTRRGRSRSIRPGRASCSSPASASSPRAPTPGGRASRATSTTARSPCEDAADALGGFRSLSESEAFAIEYWPLERYKLAQAPPRGELAGRVALITGGASGIGRATARLLAERGAHVVVADLNVDGAQEVADELVAAYGVRRASRSRVDVTSEDAVVEMTRRAVLEYGGIDILVASAGLATSAPITETTLADWELNYAVLARGYFLAAREAFRVLLAQGRGGSVVFVALEERAGRRARTPRPTRRPRPRRCTWRAASPRRAARTGSASTPSTPTP